MPEGLCGAGSWLSPRPGQAAGEVPLARHSSRILTVGQLNSDCRETEREARRGWPSDQVTYLFSLLASYRGDGA